jgi:UbiD family decarboxylase
MSKVGQRTIMCAATIVAVEPVRSLREHLFRLRRAGELAEHGRTKLGDVPSIVVRSGKRAGIVDVEGYSIPFAFNTLSSGWHAAQALGVEEPEFRSRFLDAAANPRKPSSVGDLGLRGPMDPDLEALPVPKYYEGDAGRYVTSSVVFAKSPEGGFANASIHRIRILDGRRGVIRMVENRHLHRLYTEASSAGMDLKIVVEIGANPLVELSAAYQAPFGSYEVWVANSLAGGTMTFAEVGGIEVPTGCEVLLEGRIRRDVLDSDVMVDMLGLYDKPRMQPIVEFDRMYLSENPIFRGLLAGGAEHRFLMSFPVEVKLEQQLRNMIPGVRRVVLTEGGGRWLHAVIQLEKRMESDPRTAIIAAFTYDQSLKMVTVVDDDINPEDPEDVEFAIATRFQPDRDLIVLSGMRGSSLDPSSDQATLTTAKWGIDATAPIDSRDRFRRARIA